MLIFFKIPKHHVKALLLPGKSIVAVISPVMETFPYFYSVGLYFSPIFMWGWLKFPHWSFGQKLFHIALQSFASLWAFLCVCVCITNSFLFKEKKKREKCDTRPVNPTCHRLACWRDFSFKAVSLGSQLTYDSTIVELEIVEWEESHQHHICSDFLLSSFLTDKYEREET